ncbi:O-antigen ligase family protein [Propioniciclava soli]|uniref:O-antigen ligase family protein n=1 Tax=Propioniciclava soli TaxID=2775081 RepID=UPI001E529788
MTTLLGPRTGGATAASAPAPRTSAPAGTPRLLSDPVATALLVFCSLLPLKWWQLGVDVALPLQPDHLMWGLGVLAVGGALIGRRPHLRHVWVPVTLVPYLLWLALSVSWSVEPARSLLGVAYLTLWVVFGLFIAVGRNLGDLLTVVSRAVTVVLALHWTARIVSPGTAIHTDLHAGALRGLVEDKNLLGYWAVFGLLAAGAHTVAVWQDRRARLVPALTTLAALATILATTSKTALSMALLGVAVGGFLVALSRTRRPYGVPLTVTAVVVAPMAYLLSTGFGAILELLGRDPSLTGRVPIWNVVRFAIAERPVTGYGWDALWIAGSPTTQRFWAMHYDVPFHHAHNGYLDLAAQIGIVGLVLALVFVGSLLFRTLPQFLAEPTAPVGWLLALVVVLLSYNATEVVGFTNVTWVVLVAGSAILSRKGN